MGRLAHRQDGAEGENGGKYDVVGGRKWVARARDEERRYIGCGPAEDRNRKVVADGEAAITHLGGEQLGPRHQRGAYEQGFEGREPDVGHYRGSEAPCVHQQEQRIGKDGEEHARAYQQRLAPHAVGERSERWNQGQRHQSGHRGRCERRCRRETEFSRVVDGQIGEDGVEAYVVDDDEARYLQDRDPVMGYRLPER